MYLLYCDESNLEERAGDFLLYGGVIVPANRASDLNDTIEQLRVEAGIAPKAVFKFNPALEPLDHAGFRELKGRIIQAAVEHDCKLLAYVTLHDLARDPDTARLYGINTICYHFHCVLNRLQDKGLVLIDRFNDERNAVDSHMREKMAIGVRLNHRDQPTRLTNIVGFHYSAIGQAHFTSLTDILIGSLRFSINAHTRNDANLRNSAVNLLGLLCPLFYREPGREEVRDLGFCFSPMRIQRQHFHERYVSLQYFLREAGVASSQDIVYTG